MSSLASGRQATGYFWRFALTAFVVTAMSAGTPAAATAQEGPGGIGLRLVEAPTAAKDDPRARIYIVDHLAPGTVIERRVEVSNSTTSNHQVALYSSAATIEDGVFVGAAGETANELSRWTTVTPGTVDVAAGEKLTAVVEVAVPKDAAPGERYAVVWAEARSEPAVGGVVQVGRVGIRLYLSIGSALPPLLTSPSKPSLPPGRPRESQWSPQPFATPAAAPSMSRGLS